VLHARGFHAPNAHLTPAADGHVFDEAGFEGGLRLEFLEETGVESGEAISDLAFENDGIGEHAVSYGVEGGVDFALGSDGAAGFGAVGAGSLDLTFGAHDLVLHVKEGEFSGMGGGLLIAGEI
jgi:hypothetical protein